jgi:hypothetical protein
MISAAAITYQLQNNSIDHVRKTYLKDLSYVEDEGGNIRFDRPCRRSCADVNSAANRFLKTYPNLLGRRPSMGEWIGDLTLIRVGYSFERAFAEADKGALFESVAISRMILEQICWAYSIRTLDKVEHIRRKSATRSVGEVSRVFLIAGRFYGWLSDHAHWAYSAHVKAITFKDEYSGAMFASSLFKAIAYAMLLVLCEVYLRVFDSISNNYQSKELSSVRKEWSIAARQFKPEAGVEKIARLSDSSPDVLSLLRILKDQPRHG